MLHRNIFPCEALLAEAYGSNTPHNDELPIELEYAATHSISPASSHQSGAPKDGARVLNPSANVRNQHVLNQSAGVLNLSARVLDADSESTRVPNASAGVPSGGMRANTRGGVWAKERLPAGIRYGPFKGELRKDAVDPSKAWEIVDSTGKVKGWLDGSLAGNWLRHVRSTHSAKCNLVAIQVQDEVYYETRGWVERGEELLLHEESGLLQEKDLHVTQQHASTVKRFPCSKCNKLFKSKVALRRHVTYVCNNKFAIFNSLNQEFRDEQSGVQTVIKDGGDSDSSKRSVEDDQLTKNAEKTREFACDNCPRGRKMAFSSAAELGRHIAAAHPGARSHACAHCRKTFATASGLKQHQHIHSSVKPFQCHVCSKSYTQFSNLCRHKRMHTDCRHVSPLQCTRCYHSFPSSTALAKHQEFCTAQPQIPTLNLADRIGLGKTPWNRSDKGLSSVGQHVNPETGKNSWNIYDIRRHGHPNKVDLGKDTWAMDDIDRQGQEHGHETDTSKSNPAPKSLLGSSNLTLGYPFEATTIRQNDSQETEKYSTNFAQRDLDLLRRPNLTLCDPFETISILPKTEPEQAVSKATLENYCLGYGYDDMMLHYQSNPYVQALRAGSLADHWGLRQMMSTMFPASLTYNYTPFLPIFTPLIPQPPLVPTLNPVPITPQPSVPATPDRLTQGTDASTALGLPSDAAAATSSSSSTSPGEKFLCGFCHKSFPRAANLTRHLRTHTGEQPYRCPCCDRSFSISSNLQRHIRNVHSEDVVSEQSQAEGGIMTSPVDAVV